MGRLIRSAVDEADDLETGGLYAPGHAGDELGFSDDPAALRSCEVVVEVTKPSVVFENVIRWRDHGSHVVVGTSGFDDSTLDRLREAWGSGPNRCLVVPNFSVGAVLMMRFAAVAARHFAGGEVVEYHHVGKFDAPSGTALATAASMGVSSADADTPSAGDSTPESELTAARGLAVAGARIHSVRLPGLLAHQEVVFGNEGELLTIRHDTTDRAAFTPGVLMAVRNVAGLQDSVTVGLDSLIG